jgi:hypothetical protein
MNVYIVVDGEIGEKQVYNAWIPLLNPALTPANTLDKVQENNFYIIHSGGYPGYFKIIENAITDMSERKNGHGKPLFDRLIVSTDSEDSSLQEKLNEVQQYIQNILRQKNITTDCRIIVQHFCLETWGLGNRALVGKNIQTPLLKKYISHFNVAKSDPENLPPLPEENLNRAQFAEKYLRKLLQEKHRNLTYTKSVPTVMLHNKYFEQLKSRLKDTGHIASFQRFIDAFSS